MTNTELDNQVNWSDKNLLLIEDDDVCVELVKIHLRSTSINLLYAFNGEEALTHLANEHIDAMLIDILLPDMTGFDLFNKMQDAGHDVPVISNTALFDSADHAKAMKLGFKDYLVKPLNKPTLINALSSCFE